MANIYQDYLNNCSTDELKEQLQTGLNELEEVKTQIKSASSYGGFASQVKRLTKIKKDITAQIKDIKEIIQGRSKK